MLYRLGSIVLVSFCLFVNISFAKEQERKTEIMLDSSRLVDNTCYYQDQAYSRGALISIKVNNKTVQLKCDLINHFEFNGAVGWIDLLTESEYKQTGKITINRE